MKTILDTKNPAKCNELLDFLISEFKKGKVLEIEVKEYKISRSLDQNRLYWRILSIISGHTGFDKEYMHDYLRSKLLPPKIIEIVNKKTGEITIAEVLPSTKEMKVKEFSDYIESIYVWSSENFDSNEYSVVLPKN